MVVDRQGAFWIHENSLPSVDEFMWGSRCFSLFSLVSSIDGFVTLGWAREGERQGSRCLLGSVRDHQPAFWISGYSSPLCTCSKTDCSSGIVGFYLRILLSFITIWTCMWLLANVFTCIEHINSRKKSDQLFYSCIGSMCSVHFCPVCPFLSIFEDHENILSKFLQEGSWNCQRVI